MVEPDWMRPGATVIDVGINRITDAAEAERIFANFPAKLAQFREKGSVLVGDVHPDVAEVAGALTPVPGGVGPLTIAMLMSNTVKAARLRRGASCERHSRCAPDAARRADRRDRCGKSTVAAMMRELGCHVLEADKMAHQMIEPGGAAYDDVVREFGRRNSHSDGLRGPAKARPPSSSPIPTRSANLNAIVHPHRS